MTLPLAPFERVLRDVGAERVSPDAANALREITEEYAMDLAGRVVTASRHAGRSTIKREDVLLSTR